MNDNKGILAYGSLINNPGSELSEIIIGRIKCITPFSVEFARKSRKRSDGPTLVPVQVGGLPVNSEILVVHNAVSLDELKNILWRRETGNDVGVYTDVISPNKVYVDSLINFCGISTVLYTRIGSNIDELNSSTLADLAIQSILLEAGKTQEDGVRYLLNTKQNNIVTAFSAEYEKEILRKTKTSNLEEAIVKLDLQRETIKDARIP